jgi:hypothetical protein
MTGNDFDALMRRGFERLRYAAPINRTEPPAPVPVERESGWCVPEAPVVTASTARALAVRAVESGLIDITQLIMFERGAEEVAAETVERLRGDVDGFVFYAGEGAAPGTVQVLYARAVPDV